MTQHKKNMVTTEPWPALREGRLYKARIKRAVPDKATGFLQATVENFDPTQLGRIHELKLPLPLRPGNRLCAFLAACGIDASAVGTAVDLERIVDAVVGMRVRPSPADGSEEFDFEPISRRPAASDTDCSATET